MKTFVTLRHVNFTVMLIAYASPNEPINYLEILQLYMVKSKKVVTEIN